MKKHSVTWILVANRSHAQIFESSPELALIRTVEHPEGKLKAGDINSDRSGKAFQRYGTGASALDKANSPTEHEADRFALSLAQMLQDECARNAFAQLVLIAEPRFLGKLRESLTHPMLARVELSIPGDIAGLEGEPLRAQVERLLFTARAS